MTMAITKGTEIDVFVPCITYFLQSLVPETWALDAGSCELSSLAITEMLTGVSSYIGTGLVLPATATGAGSGDLTTIVTPVLMPPLSFTLHVVDKDKHTWKSLAVPAPNRRWA